MNFASDNAAGVAPEILAAITASAQLNAPAYGADAYTARAQQALSILFEREVAAFFVSTGTAANALALASLTRPWQAIFCHEEAHIHDDECGAPELFTAGAKLVGIPGLGGKITPEALRVTLDRFALGSTKNVDPGCLSLSQLSEAGTLYRPAEIAALSRIAHDAGLGVHMDGARFANAVAASGASPAELSWRAGVDVLSFGATKNGALACEAVIFFNPAKAAQFAVQRKRGGHTLSKGRFLGAQMEAYLEGGLWLKLAQRANAAAARLTRALSAIPGVRLPWPAQANELFPILPKGMIAPLRAASAQFYEWSSHGVRAEELPGAQEVWLRLVCSFETRAEEIDAFIGIVQAQADSSNKSTLS